MGITTAKCCALEEPSHSHHPEPLSMKVKKAKHRSKNTDSSDFISQYGSHFSSSSTLSCSSSCSSSSSSSSSSSYSSSSYTSNSYTVNRSHSKTQTYSSVNTTSLPQHNKSCSYSVTQNVGHKSQVTCVVHNWLEGKCEISRCDALRRITKGLKWHSKVQNKKAFEIKIPKEFKSTYKHFMDDYQHLLMEHLFELKAIREEVHKSVARCDTNKCVSFKRYTETCSKDLSLYDDTQFFLNILDLIHCYIVHSTNGESF